MSTYYDIHTEVSVGGRWYCADPKILKIPCREGEELGYDLSSTYWNGSRSYFGEAAERLEELSVRVPPDRLSEEMQEHFRGYNFSSDDARDRYFARSVYVIPYQSVKDAIASAGSTTSHGIAHKDAIAAFEAGDAEDICCMISPEEYTALAPEAQKCYQYYEWDDPMHWLSGFKEIQRRVDNVLYLFESVNILCDVDAVRIVLSIS